jgi:hypothetical protein
MTSIRKIKHQFEDVYESFRDIYSRLPIAMVNSLFSEIKKIREDAIGAGINYYPIEAEIASDVFGSMMFSDNPAVVSLICAELPYLTRHANMYGAVTFEVAHAYQKMLISNIKNVSDANDVAGAINKASKFWLLGYDDLFKGYIARLTSEFMDSNLTPGEFWRNDNKDIPASSITDMLNMYHQILEKSEEPIDRDYETLIYSFSNKYLKPCDMAIVPNEESIHSIVSSGRVINFGELGRLLRFRNSDPEALYAIINGTDLHACKFFVGSVSSISKDLQGREFCKIKLFLEGNPFATLSSIKCLFNDNYVLNESHARWAFSGDCTKASPNNFDKLMAVLCKEKNTERLVSILKAGNVPDHKIIEVTGAKSVLIHDMGL